MQTLPRPLLNVVLLHPQTARNVGAVGRLSSCADIALHLVRPLGFSLPSSRPAPTVQGGETNVRRPSWERELRRGGLDYWDRTDWRVHDSFEDLCAALKLQPSRDAAVDSNGPRSVLFTTRADRLLWDEDYDHGDVLIFGSESSGAPQAVHDDPRVHARVRIPHYASSGARSLNLASSVSIAAYEALRQIHRRTGET